MKNLAFILPIATAFALTACDNIDENERWNEKVPVEIKKNVLIEDFTGQKCVNCPTAANLIHTLQEGKIGENIIAVSIHGGSMSYSVDKIPFGLATSYGEEYNNHWGVKTWPNGMVDRKGGLQEFTQWETSIAQRLTIEPKVDINIHTEYDGNATDEHWGKAIITVNLTDNAESALENAYLNVWITENDIVAMQLQPDGSNKTDYIHNHVLRDVLTETYGETVNFDAEGRATKTITYDVPKVYGRGSKSEVGNMNVVVFVTDGAEGEVLQVEDATLAPATE